MRLGTNRCDELPAVASSMQRQGSSMELRHLRYFVAVAEELHFSRAAERLHIAQPAVSEQVRKLEQELGVRLLNRTKRTASLTEAGAALLVEARRVLQQVELARLATREARDRVANRLRIFVDVRVCDSSAAVESQTRT